MVNRQQKQAAKAVRRRQAVAAKQRAERSASSPAARIAAAAAGPVDRCLRTADMASAGIGHLMLARRLPSGALGCSFLLVDLLCLGVKDAYFRELAPSELDERLEELAAYGQPMVAIDPASAKALIRGAVAFADRCGQVPADDYRAVMGLFEGIDAEAATELFAFGRDGEAVYIPGPKDGSAKVREVERRLRRALGDDGWDIDVPAKDGAVLRSIADLLERARHTGSDGPVIEHEGSTEPPTP